jgi:hypothetical protein
MRKPKKVYIEMALPTFRRGTEETIAMRGRARSMRRKGTRRLATRAARTRAAMNGD